MIRKIDILNFTPLPFAQIYPYDLSLSRERGFYNYRVVMFVFQKTMANLILYGSIWKSYS